MKYSSLALAVVCFAGCKAKAPTESKAPVAIEISTSTETVPTEAELRLALKDIDFEFNGFNPTDKSTWGEVAETDSDGNPTKYIRALPNGNGQVLILHHGSPNTKFNPSSGIIGSEYIHWHRPNITDPIVVFDEMSPGWKTHLRKAIKSWNRSPYINLIVQPSLGGYSGPNFSIQKCREHNDDVITICDYDFRTNPNMSNGLGGYTWEEFGPDGHITSAVIHINSSSYKLDPKNPRLSKDRVDGVKRVTANRDLVVCHEFGHAIGLEHFKHADRSTVFGTCMEYTNDPWNSTEPNQNDLNTLAITYGHSHDTDQSLGVFCKEETDETIRTYYLQRVTYNGVKAFAQKERTFHKVNPQTQGPHFVRFDLEDKKRVTIRWERLNLNKMYKHTDDRTGEFPALNNGEMRAKVTTDSRYESVEEKLLTLLRDGKVKNGPTGCTKLTEEQAKDVSRFTPPKNGQGSGSYQRFQKKENHDGSRSDAPDVEKIYKYVDLGSEAQIIDDPVIEPFSAPEPAK